MPSDTMRIASFLFFGSLLLCGETLFPDTPSAASKAYSGTVSVGFFNGQNISTMATVYFPSGCNSPVITTQTTTGSIACSSVSSPQTLGLCPNYQGNTSQLVHSYVAILSASAANLYLEAKDGVCVGVSGSAPLGSPCGAVSPAYQINYILTCN